MKSNECDFSEKTESGSDSKKMYVLAHCLLNPAARVKGIRKPVPFDFHTDYFSRTKKPERSEFVIQLPCPETIYFGTARGTVTKDQLDFLKYRLFCADLFKPYAEMIEQFEKDGFSILILGVSKSPSCGVFVTTSKKPSKTSPGFEEISVDGRGIFIEEIQKELKWRNVHFVLTE
ncbi:hypothetical protein [Methanolapillus millepedarum]|uniref:DUF523 domain-containing protein n=1 Tax=Methanolapillus millepedarum TaxID=3028296 RepID=A0AA96VDE1_9EURY|nr:hypothetical protein MsAc7_01860 [Methanosarcinaceae archaeon Ac7]